MCFPFPDRPCKKALSQQLLLAFERNWAILCLVQSFPLQIKRSTETIFINININDNDVDLYLQCIRKCQKLVWNVNKSSLFKAKNDSSVSSTPAKLWTTNQPFSWSPKRKIGKEWKKNLYLLPYFEISCNLKHNYYFGRPKHSILTIPNARHGTLEHRFERKTRLQIKSLINIVNRKLLQLVTYRFSFKPDLGYMFE